MIAAFFAMLIISVWFGTRVDAVTLSDVTVRGGETISHDEVRRVAEEKLSGSYWKVVPRAFAFTYPHEDIAASIKAMERVKDVQVVRSGGTRLSIDFSEYVPHALWCSPADNTKCHFLDESGYSFSPAPTLQGGSFLRFVAVGKEPTAHTQAFSAEEYVTALSLVTKFAEAKWYVSRIDIDAAGDAFLTIVEGGEFKVSLKQSADETVSNLLAVLGSEQFAHIKPGNFEYIDLRFGSKVFVNEVTLESAVASTTPSATEEVQPPQENSGLATSPTEEVTATLMTAEATTSTEE